MTVEKMTIVKKLMPTEVEREFCKQLVEVAESMYIEDIPNVVFIEEVIGELVQEIVDKGNVNIDDWR